MRRREEAGGGANGNEGEGKNAKSKDSREGRERHQGRVRCLLGIIWELPYIESICSIGNVFAFVHETDSLLGLFSLNGAFDDQSFGKFLESRCLSSDSELLIV